MPGHVFVVQGDISRLVCDSYASPSLFFANDNEFFDHPPHLVWISGYLRKKSPNPNLYRGIVDLKPEDRPLLVRTSSPFIKQIVLNDPEGPLVYSIDISFINNSDMDENVQVQRISLFLDVVQEHIKREKKKPLHGRSKYLFVVPVIGTGGGGNYMRTGLVVKQILDLLWSCASKTDEYDLALCCYDVETLQLAQQYRFQNIDKAFPNYQTDTPFFIPERFENVFSVARYLAKSLSNDELVLFIGNEIIKGSGIPSWDELLDIMAVDVNINPQSGSWMDMDIINKAEIVQFRCEKQGHSIGELIQKKLKFFTNTLQSLLLAGLQCKEVVTTNYDQCFEQAVKDQHLEEKMSVIPTNICRDTNKWLLKLHGCISKPSSIVVTRQDYLRYMESNAALAGIVQAKMLTSQLLFIGFSMEDENFHKIMDSVLKAKKEKHSTVGITLQPLHNKYTCELWEPAIECVSMREITKTTNTSEALRDLEMFIDLVFVQKTKYDCGYVLDIRFKELLSEEERTLQVLLSNLKADLDKHQITIPEYPCVMEMFGKYGKKNFTIFNSNLRRTFSNHSELKSVFIKRNNKIKINK